MNLQEIFDKSVAHLRKQGVQSINQSLSDSEGMPFCAYRGDNGRMCAIGCLIPDSQYEKRYEGKTASWVAEEEQVTAITRIQGNNLNELQRIHDQNSPDDWENLWSYFAETRGLTFTPLEG
jgi:hypothetical protein